MNVRSAVDVLPGRGQTAGLAQVLAQDIDSVVVVVQRPAVGRVGAPRGSRESRVGPRSPFRPPVRPVPVDPRFLLSDFSRWSEFQQSVHDLIRIAVISKSMPHPEGPEEIVTTADADHWDAERSAHANVPRRVAKVDDRR